MSLPLTALELIEWLDESIRPEVIFDPSESREEFLLKSGERRLVLLLKQHAAADEQERQGARRR